MEKDDRAQFSKCSTQLHRYKRTWPFGRETLVAYHISSVIRVFSFQNSPKDQDLSYKMDLDLWDFRKGKTCIIAKFHKTDLVTCSHSRERRSRYLIGLSTGLLI